MPVVRDRQPALALGFDVVVDVVEDRRVGAGERRPRGIERRGSDARGIVDEQQAARAARQRVEQSPTANVVAGSTMSHWPESSESTAFPLFCPQIVNSTLRPPGSACGNTCAYPLAAPSGLVRWTSGVPPLAGIRSSPEPSDAA